jgi:GNAT superfamily N-acetyltransferase
MVQVRKANTGDCAAIGSIIRGESGHFLVAPQGPQAQRFYAALAPSAIAQSMGDAARAYFVAELGSRVVGMIMLRGGNYVSQFFVQAQHQGHGVGAALWRVALQGALSEGASGEFKVDSSLIARPVYEKLGFTVVGDVAVRNGFTYVPMHRPASQGTCGAPPAC